MSLPITLHHIASSLGPHLLNVCVPRAGNVTYVLDDTSLPDEALLFQLYLSSPYTVLHNTSSPHAVAAYYGEHPPALSHQLPSI